MSSRGFWAKLLEVMGLGPNQGEQLDLAAQQMQRELSLQMSLAGKTVAMARNKKRELAQAVAEYEDLEAAATQLCREGNASAVQLSAIRMAETNSRIETLTKELEDLNAAATTEVSSYEAAREEHRQLLEQHGQTKALALLNQEREALQKEMMQTSGAASAKGSYKALSDNVRMKAQELRAIAELESGSTEGQAELNRAMKQMKAQKMLTMIQQKALAAPADSTDAEFVVLDKARAALEGDPIRTALPLPTMTAPVDGGRLTTDEVK